MFILALVQRPINHFCGFLHSLRRFINEKISPMIQTTNTNQNALKNMISVSKNVSIADKVYPKMLVSSKIAAKREKTNRDINGNAHNPKSSKYFFLVLS